jgi:aspartate-semialdehyde dehydrogenase
MPRYIQQQCPPLDAGVPMVIPEINPRALLRSSTCSSAKTWGTERGFIAVNQMLIQSYVPALHPLWDEFGLRRYLPAPTGNIRAGKKNFESWPEMIDNVIPYIGGEEEKSEREPLKIWGRFE